MSSDGAKRVVTAEPLDRAADFYRRALSLDPSFALAAARLARSRLWWHWLVSPLSAGRTYRGEDDRG